MSKMKELDITSQAIADQLGALIIVGLRQEGYIKDPCDDSLLLDVDRAAATFVTKLLRGEHDDYNGHDWIGEAMARREECCDLIHKVGELSEEVRQHEAVERAHDKAFDSGLPSYEYRYIDVDLKGMPKLPLPSEGNDEQVQTTEWIVYYPDHPDEGVYVIDNLDETTRIRGMDGEGLLRDDIMHEVACCNVLGAAVLPVVQTVWEEVE